MKRLLLLFLNFPLIAWSQISFDFESGSLKTWKQSRDSAWSITDMDVLSGSYSLWHSLDDSVSGEDRISFAYDSLEVNASNTIWQLRLKHSYLPSSSNKWAVFLVSDRDQEQMRPGGLAKAIILGVNFKGSDDLLKLWRMSNGSLEVLAETSLNWQEEIGTGVALIKVERSPAGEWKVFREYDPNLPDQPETSTADTSMYNWQLIGLGRDTLSIDPEYFGIYYRFSSKQDLKLWVDDILIQGSFIRDTIPPEILELKVLTEKTLRLIFSEAIDPVKALSTKTYSILGSGVSPDSTILRTQNSVDLVFGVAFESGITSSLRVKSVSDPQGNVSGLLEKEFTWFRVQSGDIIISELLFDPEPVIGLPAKEYLEIYNRSGFTVDIGEWFISTRSKQMILPEYELGRGEYLLICYKESAQMYPEAGNVIDALTTRTMFSNEGAVIFIHNRDSLLIDWMEYSPGLHENEYYASGGWSLERIDLKRNCHGPDNWTSCRDKNGGTPGKENSVKGNNPDQDIPEILNVFLEDRVSLVIEFNESMNAQSLIGEATGFAGTGSGFLPGGYDAISGTENWRIDPGPGFPDSIVINYPFYNQVRLVYGEGFEEGKNYYLEPGAGITDCSGNSITIETRYRFAIPLKPGRTEILLSEILFNPMPFCPDFVEIYNPGPATFDLADLALANRDNETAEISSAVRVLNSHHLFFPEEYIVLTPDAESLGSCHSIHDPEAVVEVHDMPAMADEGGYVLILDKYLELIDEFHYDKEMHHPGLPSGEGVSLERISFSTPSDIRSNWHSASSMDGYGTPGRQNSQYGEISISEEGIELEPEVFTPDMDGINDKLIIKYRFQSPGLTARILVFDPRGRLVKDIAGKQLLGREGFFIWDGTDRYGTIVRTGIYLVYAEVSGGIEGNRKFRKTCVLSKFR